MNKIYLTIILGLFSLSINAQSIRVSLNEPLAIPHDKLTIVTFKWDRWNVPEYVPETQGYCCNISYANGRFVPAKRGNYLAIGQLAYMANGDGTERSAFILRHSPLRADAEIIAAAETSGPSVKSQEMVFVQVMTVITLEEGESLSFAGYQNSGHNLWMVPYLGTLGSGKETIYTWATVARLW